MKNLRFVLLFFVMQFGHTQLRAQLLDGQYSYVAPDSKVLSFTIAGSGWEITNIKIFGQAATGEFRSANHGTITWYEMQTASCSYEFDVPSKNAPLILSESCSGKPAKKYTLKKASN